MEKLVAWDNMRASDARQDEVTATGIWTGILFIILATSRC